MTARKTRRNRARVLNPEAPFRRPRLALPPPEAKVLAAGGVVWRSTNGDRPRSTDVEIAVVHRPKYDDWSLPKGKVDPGEQMVVTACREVAEETGFAATCGRVVGDQRYTVAAGPKYVRYWAMHDVSGEFHAQDEEEIDILRWMPLEAAATRLDYPHDRGLLNTFAALPPATTTILLVRHGRAGSKKHWKADDLLRPLDARGLLSAERLAGVAACYKPERVLSAEPVRCLQTMQPSAARLGVPIEVEPMLGKSAAGDHSRAAVRLVRDLVAAGRPAMVCSQGEVLPDLIRGLAEHGEVRLGTLNARKGSVWALSFADGRLVDADYLPDLEPAVPIGAA